MQRGRRLLLHVAVCVRRKQLPPAAAGVHELWPLKATGGASRSAEQRHTLWAGPLQRSGGAPAAFRCLHRPRLAPGACWAPVASSVNTIQLYKQLWAVQQAARWQLLQPLPAPGSAQSMQGSPTGPSAWPGIKAKARIAAAASLGVTSPVGSCDKRQGENVRYQRQRHPVRFCCQPPRLAKEITPYGDHVTAGARLGPAKSHISCASGKAYLQW